MFERHAANEDFSMLNSKAGLLFAGSSHPELARKIAHHGSMKQGKVRIETFPDGEIGVRILENVHGKDVFVLQTIAQHPNLYLMELFIMIDALKRAGACSITAVMPYFGYARQDRREDKGDPISAKLVAHLVEAAGASRVMTMDLHSPQIEGFFNIELIHLSGEPLLIEAIQNEGWEKSVMVAPDIGSIWRAQEFAKKLKTSVGAVNKCRMSAKRVESHALAGDVEGRDVVLVDDLYSTGQTLVTAASVCRSQGAHKVRAAATHALFVTGKLTERAIEEMIVTDTTPLPSRIKSKRVKIVSVAPLFAEAIKDIA
jgi:ribose-phosphate pyrophosphokinase